MRDRPNILRIALSSAVLIANLNVAPAFADGNAPEQQSKCEAVANAYKAKHPQADNDLMNPNSKTPYPFPFRPAIPPEPLAPYRDPESGIVFAVDKDGRHVTSTAASGTQLWRRDPFVDNDMCPYRFAHPYIAWIGPPEGGNGAGWHVDSPSTARPDAMTNEQIFSVLSKIMNSHWRMKPPVKGDRFIGLAFNSSQMGYVNTRNGDFYLMGQN